MPTYYSSNWTIFHCECHWRMCFTAWGPTPSAGGKRLRFASTSSTIVLDWFTVVATGPVISWTSKSTSWTKKYSFSFIVMMWRFKLSWPHRGVLGDYAFFVALLFPVRHFQFGSPPTNSPAVLTVKLSINTALPSMPLVHSQIRRCDFLNSYLPKCAKCCILYMEFN